MRLSSSFPCSSAPVSFDLRKSAFFREDPRPTNIRENPFVSASIRGCPFIAQLHERLQIQ